jgi:hypothetical protein
MPLAVVGQVPSVPLRASAPAPDAVKDGACQIPKLSTQLVLTVLMLMSKMSAVGEAGVSRANGTLVVAAEVSFRTGFVPVSVPVREAREPAVLVTS